MKFTTEGTRQSFIVRSGERAWRRTPDPGGWSELIDGEWVSVSMSDVPGNCLVEWCKFLMVKL